VQKFDTSRDAKEFLAGRIVAEAQRESVPLSEVERKMLYFSETAWTLPDIAEMNNAFDRDYSQELDTWTEAARILRREDHYLLVMLDAAGAPSRPRGDVFNLFLTALAIVCAFLAIVFLTIR
jgi:hypothetical protein